MKRKTVKIKTLDNTFSLAIREQYNHKCAFPDCPDCGNHSLRYSGGLDCAHYRRRRYSSGRWHPDNCAALCRERHNFLDLHDENLRSFFFKLLGEVRHDALQVRHHSTFRYKPWERWEMNQHFAAQRKYMDRLRNEGEQGYLPMVAWD